MAKNKDRRNKNAPFIAVVLACVSIIIIGLLFLVQTHNPRNPVTGCSEDSSQIDNTFAFLVDASDPLTEIHTIKIQNLIASLINSTQSEDRFQVYLMTESETDAIKPIFDQCNTITRFSDSPALQRFRQLEFDRNIYRTLKSEGVARRSPIIHAINAISATLPMDASTKHLIIVSDLYEHSSLFSMYRTSIAQALRESPREITANTPDLRGVNAYIQVIDRPELEQGAEFIQEWVTFLRRAGATLSSKEIGTGDQRIMLDLAVRVTG